MTQKQVAEAMGLDQNLVSRREKGLISIKPPERKRWAEVFGLTLDEFDSRWRASKVHERPGPVGIPVINMAPAGEVQDYDHEQFAEGEFHAAYRYEDRDEKTTDPQLFAVVVVGDSMEPTLHERDVVIFRNVDGLRNGPKLEDARVVFVRFAAERKKIGNGIFRYFAEDGGKVARLQKDNPRYRAVSVPLNTDNIARIAVAVQHRSTRSI